MRALLLSICLLLGFAGTPMLAQAQATFTPGQVWTLADPAYPSVRVVIDKIETMGETSIVHISLLDVPVSDRPGEGVTFAHMPFSAEALRRSVGVLVETRDGPFSDYEAGYREWQQAHGGFFTVTVPEGIAFVLQAMGNPGAH